MNLDEDVMKKIAQMREADFSYREIADELRDMGIADLSKETVRRYCNYIGSIPHEPATDQDNIESSWTFSDPDNDTSKPHSSTRVNSESKNIVKSITEKESVNPQKTVIGESSANFKHTTQETNKTSESWESREQRERLERELRDERRKEVHQTIGMGLLLVLSVVLFILAAMWYNGDYAVFNAISHAYHEIAKWYASHLNSENIILIRSY